MGLWWAMGLGWVTAGLGWVAMGLSWVAMGLGWLARGLAWAWGLFCWAMGLCFSELGADGGLFSSENTHRSTAHQTRCTISIHYQTTTHSNNTT